MIEVKKLSRRQFLLDIARLGGAASTLLVCGSSHAQSSPPHPPSNLRIAGTGGTTRSILGQADFAYLGCYDVAGSLNGCGMNWGQSFTHRYVSGSLRFLTLGYNNGYRLLEVAAPSSFGSTISSVTNQWDDIWNGNLPGSCWMGIWWDEPLQRLWTTHARDYPSDQELANNQMIFTRALNSNGTISNLRGPIGLQGVGARQVYGGAQAVPQWFQSLYGVGPYVIGWGGYASRLGASPTSLGPTMFAIQDPVGYANGAYIPAGQFFTLMDCSSGSGANDWYSSGHPTTFDRGVRNASVKNLYEGTWQSPAPDGLGRWIWGDSNYNTGCWIDGTTKHGFITVPSFGSGNNWYETSTLNFDSRNFEIQVFDPSHLGEAKSGTRALWDVKPTNRWQISLADLGASGTGNGPYKNVGGATYDKLTKRLYIYGIWLSTNAYCRIYVYSVNC